METFPTFKAVVVVVVVVVIAHNNIAQIEQTQVLHAVTIRTH